MTDYVLNNHTRNTRWYRPVRFIGSVLLVYALWRLFKYFAEHYDNFLWGWWAKFQNLLGNFIATCTVKILQWFGYSVHSNNRLIIVDGVSPIYVADLCLGIAPLVIFTGIVMVYGNHHKNKAWFIPLGLVIILIINIIRMLALVLVLVHYRKYFGLAHDYVYVTLTYSAIFLLLVWWMEKLAFKSPQSTGQAQ